jgi:hypothetical protein
MPDEEIRFAVLAEKGDNPTVLFMHGLTIAKLYDHIIVPYEEDKPFFIDGVPTEKKSLRKIKIIREDQKFVRDLNRLHNRIKNPKGSALFTPIADYPGRLAALFQERSIAASQIAIAAIRGAG